jgi:tetratricopeptide (TPR) repeat protein
MPDMNREEIAKLEALYASNPEGRVFTHLAEAYRKGGEFERARSILEQGLTKHPSYASAHVVLGRVYADLNDTEQAGASFRHVLELDPHNLVALRSLGDLARAAGRTEEALGYFEQLRQQDPSNSDIEGVIAELKAAPAASAEPVAQPQEASASGFEEFAVPGVDEEGQAQAAPEPEPWSEPPSPEPESVEATSLDTLPGFEETPPDYGDLVSPDIDLGWSEPAAEEALPGDLADFAAQTDLEPEPPVDMPFDISSLEQPEEPVGEVVDPWTLTMDDTAPEPEPAQTPAEPEPPAEVEEVGVAAVAEFGMVTPGDAKPAAVPDAPAAIPEPPAILPVVTETMAELFTEQGLFEKAAEVYRALMNERPWDPDLPVRMADAAAKARGEKKAEPDDELESPWTSAATGTSSAPTPYAWAEETNGETTEAGPPISDYFRSLLGWRPGARGGPRDEQTTPAEPPQAAEPAMMELDTPVAAPEPMPWEVATPAAFNAAPKPSAAPPQSGHAVESAFDEWFNASDFGEEASAAPSPAPAPSATPPADEPAEGDDDDDLEMFRSWLQSLKK